MDVVEVELVSVIDNNVVPGGAKSPGRTNSVQVVVMVEVELGETAVITVVVVVVEMLCNPGSTPVPVMTGHCTWQIG